MVEDYVNAWVEAGAEIHRPVRQPAAARARTAPLDGPHARAVAEEPLGNNGKSVNPPGNHCEKLGYSKDFPPRVARYFYQSIARHLLPTTMLQSCLRKRRMGVSKVEVRKGKDRAYYGNLQTCRSVWGCPVCAAKISEVRRIDLEEAIRVWEGQGGVVLLETETVRHNANQSLAEVLKGALKSRKLMLNRTSYKAVTAKMGLVGSIRALEVTWGRENGWHVHFHVLLFLKVLEANSEYARRRLQLSREWLNEWFNAFCAPGIEKAILPLWQKACVDAGMDEPNEHGVRIQNGFDAGAYASKWGRALEMTKGHVKKGRPGRYTPWDFLRNYQPGKDGEKWGRLFQEYFWAFKGKRQLVWSEGLFKMIFGKDKREKSDAAIAAETDQTDELLGNVGYKDWGLILAREKRGEFLEVAYNGGWKAAEEYLQGLRIAAQGGMNCG
jgi:hypothetical protein